MGSLEQMYQEIILDHAKRPEGRGLREPFDAEVHHVNPTCGDELTVRVRLGDDGDTIRDMSYEGQGCSISQASASVLYGLVEGLSVKEMLTRYDAFTELMHGKGAVEADEDLLGDAQAFAGVAKYPSRVKCALLAWAALKDAIARALTARDEQQVTS